MNRSKKEITFALIQTIPVMLGYLCLGMAFGLMLQDAGYHFLWAFLCSLFIYAGSMQFVLVSLLTGGVSLIYTAVMTLFINGRHIFYGLSFVDKLKKTGKAYPYMVFSLTDETYSVLCNLRVPTGLRENRVMLYISLLDQSYWVIGSVIGGIAGQLIHFNTTGVDFSMTALFIVIVLNQWKEAKSHASAITGFCVGILFLLLLGPDRFLLPALLVVCLFFIVTRKQIDEKEEKA